jgi:hypothetical protein
MSAPVPRHDSSTPSRCDIHLAPRPGLFRFLLLAFLVWLIALLVLYFTVVYPHRHEQHPDVTSLPIRAGAELAAC